MESIAGYDEWKGRSDMDETPRFDEEGYANALEEEFLATGHRHLKELEEEKERALKAKEDDDREQQLIDCQKEMRALAATVAACNEKLRVVHAIQQVRDEYLKAEPRDAEVDLVVSQVLHRLGQLVIEGT